MRDAVGQKLYVRDEVAYIGERAGRVCIRSRIITHIIEPEDGSEAYMWLDDSRGRVLPHNVVKFNGRYDV